MARRKLTKSLLSYLHFCQVKRVGGVEKFDLRWRRMKYFSPYLGKCFDCFAKKSFLNAVVNSLVYFV